MTLTLLNPKLLWDFFYNPVITTASIDSSVEEVIQSRSPSIQEQIRLNAPRQTPRLPAVIPSARIRLNTWRTQVPALAVMSTRPRPTRPSTALVQALAELASPGQERAMPAQPPARNQRESQIKESQGASTTQRERPLPPRPDNSTGSRNSGRRSQMRRRRSRELERSREHHWEELRILHHHVRMALERIRWELADLEALTSWHQDSWNSDTSDGSSSDSRTTSMWIAQRLTRSSARSGRTSCPTRCYWRSRRSTSP